MRVQVNELDMNVVNTKSSARIIIHDSETTEMNGKFLRSSLVARPKRNLSGRRGEQIDTKTVDMSNDRLEYAIDGRLNQILYFLPKATYRLKPAVLSSLSRRFNAVT